METTLIIPAFDKLNLPISVARELRSNHAGETGAVWIYKGMLAVSRDQELRHFATEHLAAEQTHLEFFESWMPRRWHTRLGGLWKVSGWLLGAIPALFGSRAAYTTVQAVETFVDRHYAQQIDVLDCNPHWDSLREQLQTFRDDELAHRDDAIAHLDRPQSSILARIWTSIVASGSAAGVIAARRI